jgi:hypothetical protein
MNRRLFLFALTLGFSKFSIGMTPEVKANEKLGRYHKAKPFETIVVSPGENFILPTKPSHDCWVRFIVDSRALKSESLILSHDRLVDGKHEPILLDTLSNFFVKYDAANKNWQLA